MLEYYNDRMRTLRINSFHALIEDAIRTDEDFKKFPKLIEYTIKYMMNRD